jgi:hypothetical protein
MSRKEIQLPLNHISFRGTKSSLGKNNTVGSVVNLFFLRDGKSCLEEDVLIQFLNYQEVKI